MSTETLFDGEGLPTSAEPSVLDRLKWAACEASNHEMTERMCLSCEMDISVKPNLLVAAGDVIRSNGQFWRVRSAHDFGGSRGHRVSIRAHPLIVYYGSFTKAGRPKELIRSANTSSKTYRIKGGEPR